MKQEILQYAENNGWRYVNNGLIKTFSFENFYAAQQWINDVVADTAKNLNHHPNIMWEINKVTLITYTKDANDVTEKDLDLIKKIDAETVNLTNSTHYK